MSGLWQELKRRNVIKVGIAYLIAAWVVAQVVGLVKEPLHLPPWFDTAVIVVLIIGFPFALIVAWAFERTPQGVRRTAREATAGDLEATENPDGFDALPYIAAEEASVAVLPFVNMSSDPEQEYFSDGISEELLNQLAKVRDLHVAGRTSSFQFKGHVGDIANIAAKLKVAHVLEGSVRKAGNQVRVTAQLIKAADGYHLWSETYDRELDDIFGIQEEIAHAVTGALSITLGVGDLKVGTRNVAAYDAFLAGRAQYHSGGPEDWLAAVEVLRKATRLDPEFLDAQVMLANVANNALNMLPPDRSEEFIRIQKEAVERAVAIAPDAPEVLCVRGLQEQTQGHLLQSGQMLEEAARRASNDSVVLQSWSTLLAETGRIRDSLAVMRRWVRVEPLYIQPAYILAMTLETAGEADQAMQQYEVTGRLQGNSNAFAGPQLVVALNQRDRPAIEAGLEKMLQDDLGVTGHLELTKAMCDHLDEPEAALAVLRRTLADSGHLGALMKSVIAIWASYFGDDELALEAYRGIVGMPARMIWTVVWRPLHRQMRQLPGFKELVRDLGLVEYWRGTGHWGDYVRPVGEDDFEIVG